MRRRGGLACLPGEVLLPGALGFQEMIGDIKVDAAGGTGRRFVELHTGLLRRPTRFMAIAGRAGAYQVLPGMLAALMPGNNVV
jgi:hypothetical protein